MTTVYRAYIEHDGLDAASMDGAALQLRDGGLVLLPTETVYGIGVSVEAYRDCSPMLPCEGSGYRRIFSLKQRELTQTVPWLVGGADALDRYGRRVPGQIRALADACWPGALTVVVEASDEVPEFMRAADGTVALRASASPVVAALIERCGSPLAVTSANTHGLPAPSSFADVEARVLEGVDVAIDAGVTACRDASSIVAVRDGRLQVLREGALTAKKLLAIAGETA